MEDAPTPSSSPCHKKKKIMDTDDLSTFSSFLKRISRMEDDEGGMPGGGRFSTLLNELRSPDRTAQVVALTELSECLCISSEELLISFPIDSFMPVLVHILDDPGDDDAAATRMVLCCRCIHNVIDILPQISGVVIAAGALPVMCSKLLNIEFIDVAELCVQILDLIAEDQPLQVLRSGGFSAVLTFLEFFPQAIQRQAACAAGKMLSAKTTIAQFDEFVRPVFPTLAQLINNQSSGQSDPHVQHACCECWRRALDLVVIHYDKNFQRNTRGEKGQEKGPKSQPKEIFSQRGSHKEIGWQHGKRSHKEPLVAELLAEILPESVFLNFIQMLAIKDNDQVLMEVLYIVSTTCALSDSLCLIAIQNDIGRVLFDSLEKDISPTLVLSVLISILPLVQLNDDGQFEIDNNRLAVFHSNPDLLKGLIDIFLPKLLRMCHNLTEQSVRPLAVSTMLAFIVTTRSLPQVLTHVDQTQLTEFLASVLEFNDSKPKSEVLAVVTIAKELLAVKWDPYAQLFVKYGILQCLGKFSLPKKRKQQKRRRRSNLTTIIYDAAREILAMYATENLSKAIDASDGTECLEKVERLLFQEKYEEGLRELHACLGKVSGYQFVASKLPATLLRFFREDPAKRLDMFMREMKVEKDNGARFGKLCRLCVDAVAALDHLPLKIYQTPSNSGRLPLHLRPEVKMLSGLDPGSSKGGRKGNAAGAAVFASNSSLYLLKLMSKPFKARLVPKKTEDERQIDELAEELRSFENLASLTFLSESSTRLNEESGGSVGSDGRPHGLRPLRFNPASPSSWSLGASMMLRVKRMSDGSRKEKAPSMPLNPDLDLFAVDRRDPDRRDFTANPERQRDRYSNESSPKSVSGALSELSASKSISSISGRDFSATGRFDSGLSLTELANRLDKEEGFGAPPLAQDLGPPLAQDLGPPLEQDLGPPLAQDLGPEPLDKNGIDMLSCRTPEMSLLLIEPLATLSQLEDFVLQADSKRSPKNSPMVVGPEPIASKKVILYSPNNPDVPLNMDQSIIQVLLNDEYGKTKCTPTNDDSEKGRFLVSDTHEGTDTRRLQCASMWSKIHLFSYEVVAGDQAPVQNSQRPMGMHATLVATPYEKLVKRVQALDLQFDDANWRETLCAGEDTDGFLHALLLLQIIHSLSTYVDETVEGSEPRDFVSHQLSLKMSMQLSDPLAVATRTIPSWCTQLGMHNFLLSATTRNYLHHCCGLGVNRGLNFLQARILASCSPTAEMKKKLESEIQMGTIPRQKVRISRSRMLESAAKLMSLYGNKKPALEVEYQGEVGTGSGPTLEFYASVADELKKDSRLFCENTPNGLLFPKPFRGGFPRKNTDATNDDSSVLERFTLMGQLIAKAIVDNRLVDLYIHPIMWNLIRGVNENTPTIFHQKMLRDVDPMLWSSLEKLLHMEERELHDLQLDFILPGYPDISLRADGKDMMVTKQNVKDYVFAVAKISLLDSVKQPIFAFREGFCGCLPLSAVSMWTDHELAELVVGCAGNEDEYWTIESLTKDVKAMHGYKADSEDFMNLLRVMASFTTQERRSFLAFCTGSPTLPKKGFAALRPPLVVVRKEATGGVTADRFLPSVMTCANYLKLPPYSSLELLEEKLKIAMKDGQGSFLLS